MSTQHTPGPWKVSEWRRLEPSLISAGGNCIAVVHSTFTHPYSECSTVERVKNAELMGAAPDLLRELIVAHLIIRNAALIMEPEQLSRWVEINNLKTGTLRHSEREVVITKAEGGEA